MRTRQISALGQSQLEAWEKIAKSWLMVPETRTWVTSDERNGTKELHLCCPVCEESVYAIGVQAVSPEILLASTVAHLRNMHRELDPDA